MYINGIGVANKKEIAKTINLDMLDYRNEKDDIAYMYKVEMIRRESSIGEYGDTFRACIGRIDQELVDRMLVSDLAKMVDAIHAAYQAGKHDKSDD